MNRLVSPLLLRLLLTGFLLLGSLAPAAANVEIERISLTPRSDGKGYVLRLHTDATIEAYTEATRLEGGHFEIVLFNTHLASTFHKTPLDGPITDYAAEHKSEHLTLTFWVDNLYTIEVYPDRGTPHLLIGLSSENQFYPVSNPVSEPVPVGPSQSARERWRIDTIVIDAGHGGKDPGAIGVGGIYEKDIALSVALKLGAYLEDLLGVNVVYTRDDDRFIPLKERGRIANEAGGKLFVSIHANALGSPNAYGTQTYFLGTHKSEAARNVMERENSVIELETDQEHYKAYDQNALIRMVLAQSAYMRESERLASMVEDQFANRVQRRSRGIKQAGFYVLWSASMPSILVELGFITNPRESRYLRTDEGQTYLASAIYRAIRDYKMEYEKKLDLTQAK